MRMFRARIGKRLVGMDNRGVPSRNLEEENQEFGDFRKAKYSVFVNVAEAG